MAVLEIGIPTGFAADKKSVTQHPLLKRTEDGDDKINLYFDEVLVSKIHVIRFYNSIKIICFLYLQSDKGTFGSHFKLS